MGRFLAVVIVFVICLACRAAYMAAVVEAQTTLAINQVSNDTATPILIRTISSWDYYISHGLLVLPVLIAIYLYRKAISSRLKEVFGVDKPEVENETK